jgi:hypothetical protein
VIDRHLLPGLGAVPLARLTMTMIDELDGNLRGRYSERELSPGTSASHPRRVAPSARASAALGVDLYEPGLVGAAASW